MDNRQAIRERVERRFANAVLGGALCLTLLWLAAQLRGGASVLAPLGAAALLGAGFRLPPRWRSRLALLTLSAVLGLYGAELLLTASAAWVPARQNYVVDPRDKLKVLADLRASGTPAETAFSAGLLLLQSRQPLRVVGGGELLPLAGVASRTTVYCKELGPYVVYRSDEHGFHNPPSLWSRPDVSLAVVGDSFVQGACVGSEANLVARLRERWSRTVNLGLGATGPLTHLAAVREYAAALRPRALLWVYFEGNDLTDAVSEAGYPLLPRYLENGFSQDLIHRQPQIDAAVSEYLARQENWICAITDRRPLAPSTRWAPLIFSPGTARLARLRARLGELGQCLDQPRAAAFPPEAAALLEGVLRRARDLSASWGGKMYFAVLPSWEAMTTCGGTRGPALEIPIAVARGLGIPVIDVYQAFHQHGSYKTLFAYPYAHYSEKGYALAADTVARSLGGSL